MTERDFKIAARYREMASEEPSVLIDDAIRAAARRAVATRRASFEKRWAMPVSIAAVLVLAVGVTLRMQLEKPGVEVPTIDAGAPPASSIEPAAPPAAAPMPAEADTSAKRAAPAMAAPPMKESPAVERKLEVQDERRQKKDLGRLDENFTAKVAGATATAPASVPAPALKREQKPEPAPFPAAPAVADPFRVRQETSGYLAPQPLAKAKEAEVSTSDEKPMADKAAANVAAPGRPAAASIASTPAPEAAPPAAPANAPAPAAAAAPPAAKLAAGAARDSLSMTGERAASPEKELERIAELRRAGRDTEADEALARFKREHPDYRIAEDVWEKVRPR